MMAAMASPTVALVSGDLLLASRLRAALKGTAEVAIVGVGEVPPAEVVFVDLNDDADARIELIATLRRGGDRRIVGFCQHDARDVRIRAMESGADQVVTNGALQQAALRLVGVTTGG
jgi:DNA-binding NarL/FixJ family response regulator